MKFLNKQFIFPCLFALFIFWGLFSEYGSDSIIVLLFFFLVICGVTLLVFYGKYLLFFLSNNMKKIYHLVKENKKIALYVFLGLVLFFWFAIRPAIIKSSCANNYNYERCIHKYGL